jgi:P27 family predicted phage terminase small subunit
MKKHNAPGHLSKEAREVWRVVVDSFDLLDSDFVLLRVVCESFDRLQAARRAIEKEGMILTDANGRKYLNPACSIEKESRMGLLRAWRQLNLDIEAPAEVGRPPGR